MKYLFQTLNVNLSFINTVDTNSESFSLGMGSAFPPLYKSEIFVVEISDHLQRNRTDAAKRYTTAAPPAYYYSVGNKQSVMLVLPPCFVTPYLAFDPINNVYEESYRANVSGVFH